MTNEMKLLMALCDALGFEVEKKSKINYGKMQADGIEIQSNPMYPAYKNTLHEDNYRETEFVLKKKTPN